MENNKYHSSLLGDIVASDFRSASILKNAGLDFCCGGQKTLEFACQELSISPDPIIINLIALETISYNNNLHFDEWDLDLLADHIEDIHHAYIFRTLPELEFYTAKISSVHGAHHPELIDIEGLVNNLSKELPQHLHKENDIVFPAIRKAFRENDMQAKKIIFKEIEFLQNEHESAGSILHQINHLSKQYKLPTDSCQSYTVAFKLLEEFEDDLHIHIHLENNILFPKALKL